MQKKLIRIAAIDLYNNEPNEGMRCIGDIVREVSESSKELTEIRYDVFESRYKGDIPELGSYDIFISSGGPGSPFEDEGKKWENDYFSLVNSIYNNNLKSTNEKKYIFFICHSFQLMARIFGFADVTQRFKKSFGIWDFEKTSSAENDAMFHNLHNPFYAADFRQYQVVNKNKQVLDSLGASVLSTEIDRHDGNEPALMAVRISDEIAGTQFHPEADPESMIYHFRQEERKKFITEEFGEKMYFQMIESLEDPDKIKLTRKTVIPSFLGNAVNKMTAAL